MLFAWLRKRRRTRLLNTPIPDALVDALRRNVAWANDLAPTVRARLVEDSRIFAAEKYFEGCAGQAVDDEVRFTIASQACMLTLGLGIDAYHKVKTVLVYPTGYTAPVERGPARVSTTEFRLGEAWYGGPVILAWDAVLRGGRKPSEGRNVVLHEFAHQLDYLDGIVDGTPPIEGAHRFRRWRDVMTAEYRRLIDDSASHRATLLDYYGTTNPAEFFAVATECFFMRAGDLKSRHRDLFLVLADFYRVDPTSF